MIELTYQDVRGLKGAPVSLLILLLISSAPVDQIWLSIESGYTEKTVGNALGLLKDRGFAVCNKAGWFISGDCRVSIPARDYDSKLFRDPPKAVRARARLTRDESPKVKLMWEILKQAGVRRNDRTQKLLTLPHVNPDYLRAKVDEFKHILPGRRNFSGMLIRSVERGESAPEPLPNGHLRYCSCSSCQVTRFLGKSD